MNRFFWKYLGIYMGTYLLISLFEIFLLSPLIDFFGNGFWIRFLIFSILFLLLNPFLVRFLGDRIAPRIETRTDTKESE